jgi:hypothetical protein
MTAHELLSQLREKGVEVKTSGDDRLVIDAPKGTVTEELRSALSANKAELLQILKAEQAANENAAASEPPELFPTEPEPVLPAAEVAPVAPPPPVVSATPVESVTAPEKPAITSVEPDHEAIVATRDAEEVAQLESELMRLRTEEEARRAEVEAARLATENALRVEQERWRQMEEETARARAQKERERIEVEARQQAEEEHHRQIAEQ